MGQDQNNQNRGNQQQSNPGSQQQTGQQNQQGGQGQQGQQGQRIDTDNDGRTRDPNDTRPTDDGGRGNPIQR